MSSEEFEKLEKREGKKKKEISRKKEEYVNLSGRKSNISDTDRLTIELEKLNGRMQMFEDLRKAGDEGMVRVSEEIGELRSSILEKERTINKMEADFAVVKEISSEIKPEKMIEDLTKKDEDILKISTRMEVLETKNKEVNKMLREIRTVVKKIKNLNYLLNLSDEIKTHMTEIEKNKKFTDRVAGKVEEIFSELKRETKEFQSSRNKIEFNEAALQDVLRDLGKLELKMEHDVPLKKDFDVALNEMHEKVTKIDSEQEAGFNQLKDIMDDFLSKMKQAGIDRLIKEMGAQELANYVTRPEFEAFKKSVSISNVTAMPEPQPAAPVQQPQQTPPPVISAPSQQPTPPQNVVQAPIPEPQKQSPQIVAPVLQQEAKTVEPPAQDDQPHYLTEPPPAEEPKKDEFGSVIEEAERKLRIQLERVQNYEAAAVSPPPKEEERKKAPEPPEQEVKKEPELPKQEERVEEKPEETPKEEEGKPVPKIEHKDYHKSQGLNDMRGNISKIKKKLKDLTDKGY